MSSVDNAAAAYVVAKVGTPLAVARGALSSLDIMEMVRAAFVAGAWYDANARRASYVVGEVDTKPRAQVKAGAGFLSDPSSALVLRGRQVVAPSVGRPASMLVTVDARRGMDVVEVGIEARELSRMLNDLYTLVVWGVPDERG